MHLGEGEGGSSSTLDGYRHGHCVFSDANNRGHAGLCQVYLDFLFETLDVLDVGQVLQSVQEHHALEDVVQLTR